MIILDILCFAVIALFFIGFIYMIHYEFSPKRQAEFHAWEKRMRHGNINNSMLELWIAYKKRDGTELFDLNEFLKDIGKDK